MSVKQVKPKQILVWRDGKQEVRTLPLSAGGRVGRTTQNIKEAGEIYERWARDNDPKRRDTLLQK